MRFGVFDGKRVGEETFGEAMTAHYIARAKRTGFGQVDLTAAR